MIEIIKTIGGVAGALTAISVCVVTLVKPIRHYIMSKIQKSVDTSRKDELIQEVLDTLKEHINKDTEKQEAFALQGEAMLGIIRDNITRLYYKYLNSNGIPSFERENLVKQYTVYHKMNGNTYVDVIYAEMLEWKVIK